MKVELEVRLTPLIIVLAVATVLAVALHASGEEASVVPSTRLYGGVSPLVLVPSGAVAVNMTVTITVAGGGGVDVYTTYYYTIARGVPWPYEEGLYAIVLPGLPAARQVVDYQGIVYLVTVNSTAEVTWPGGSVTISWRPPDSVSPAQGLRGHVFMTTPSGSKWTLYQSPSGWTAREGEPVRVYVVAFGSNHEVTGAYFYVRVGEGTWTQYLAREAPEWREGPGGAVEAFNDWISKTRAGDPRLYSLDVGVVESGGVWYLDLYQGGAGSRVSYYARVDWGGSSSETPEAFYYRAREGGPYILVIDDDTLLYWAARVGVGVLEDPAIASAPHGLLDSVFQAGDALLQAGLVAEHDWSSLASLGYPYIAFPGEESLERLGAGPDLVYVSGLPPSVPGTILYWSPYWDDTLRLLGDLAAQGTGIVATSTSLLDVDYALYPGLLGPLEHPGLAGLLGMWYASIAHKVSGLAGVPVHQVATGVTVEVFVDGLGIVEAGPGPVVTGWWSYTCPANESVIAGYDVESPWLSLRVKRLGDVEWGSVAERALEGLASSTLLWRELSSPQAYNGIVVVAGVELPLDEALRIASEAAIPLAPGCGGGQIYVYHGRGYSAVYATFEPEAGSPRLVEWIAEKALYGAGVDVVNLSNVVVPVEVAYEASALATTPWKGYLVGAGEGYVPGPGRYVVVSPRGPVRVVGGVVEHSFGRGNAMVAVVSMGNHSRILYAGGEPFAPIALASASGAATTTYTTYTTTTTSTTTTTNPVPGYNTTTTTGVLREEGLPVKAIAGLLAAIAAVAVIVVLRARERAAYKYI